MCLDSLLQHFLRYGDFLNNFHGKFQKFDHLYQHTPTKFRNWIQAYLKCWSWLQFSTVVYMWQIQKMPNGTDNAQLFVILSQRNKNPVIELEIVSALMKVLSCDLYLLYAIRLHFSKVQEILKLCRTYCNEDKLQVEVSTAPIDFRASQVILPK